MPSPFPGMDPYLEDVRLRPDVHGRLINVASELLLTQLRPNYFVQIDERVYIANEADERLQVVIPDLHVRSVSGSPSGEAGTAVLDAEPGVELGYAGQEIRESFLKVIDRDSERVITVVEILSPTNKAAGSQGKASYDSKRQELLEARVNLVEIDLLRQGGSLRLFDDRKRCDYQAQASRWKDLPRPWVTAWPMSVFERLRRIAVPVKREHRDAVLDLQKMLDIAYDRAGYDLRVDYRKPPYPALDPEAAAWADRILEPLRRRT